VEKTFIPDGGGQLERVHITMELTHSLIANEKAFAALVGSELREALLEGKNVFVKVVEPIRRTDEPSDDAAQAAIDADSLFEDIDKGFVAPIRSVEPEAELCRHGTTYATCRQGCPPWRVPDVRKPKATCSCLDDEDPIGNRYQYRNPDCPVHVHK
jgi:hypothetical protein